mmetsp:Transcript_94202/g.299040  ORF Transcript_94202/g.299040 Transcript_94202/m.299040 type:complete len:229 (-) Transcript_94202:20-706(-)
MLAERREVPAADAPFGVCSVHQWRIGLAAAQRADRNGLHRACDCFVRRDGQLVVQARKVPEAEDWSPLVRVRAHAPQRDNAALVGSREEAPARQEVDARDRLLELSSEGVLELQRLEVVEHNLHVVAAARQEFQLGRAGQACHAATPVAVVVVAELRLRLWRARSLVGVDPDGAVPGGGEQFVGALPDRHARDVCVMPLELGELGPIEDVVSSHATRRIANVEFAAVV